MKARVITGFILVVVLILLLWQVNSPIFVLAISFLSAMAVYEMTNNTGYVKSKFLVRFGVVVAALIPILHRKYFEVRLPFLAFVYLAVLALFLLKKHETTTFSELAISFFVIMVVPNLFSIFIIFRDISQKHGIFYIILAMCGSWMSDTGAYFAGVYLGKRKLSPKISPNKTVEGFIGGIISATLSFLLAGFIYSLVYSNILKSTVEVNYAILFIMGPICSISGVLGDLFASVIKRETKIKDYGDFMPGHGGVMDRFDSIIFVLPVLAMLLIYLPPVVV